MGGGVTLMNMYAYCITITKLSVGASTHIRLHLLNAWEVGPGTISTYIFNRWIDLL